MTILPKRGPEHVPIGRVGLIEEKYFIEHRLNAVRSRSRGDPEWQFAAYFAIS
jgi:hypothetical protein